MASEVWGARKRSMGKEEGSEGYIYAVIGAVESSVLNYFSKGERQNNGIQLTAFCPPLGLPFPARTFDLYYRSFLCAALCSQLDISQETASTGSAIAIPDSKLCVAIHRMVYVQYSSFPEVMSK